MKLLRHGPPGHERPGLLDAAGQVRDLSALMGDIDARVLQPGGLAALRGLDVATLPVIEAARLGVPWSGMRKFIGIGLNYADHAAEGGMPIPKEPLIFMKAMSCAAGPHDDLMLPAGAAKLDWEVELGVVIGTRAKNVSLAEALTHVAGYCVVNDLSERAWQLERSGGQWDKGKGHDGFGPIGPWLVTADEVADPQALDLWLDLNGASQQRGNTRTMIFSVAELVSAVSEFITLEPGDLITTGTPPGVGLGVKPVPRFLRDGDVLTLGIAGLGAQRQRVRSG
ncbi:MAG: fumarylacetoacetate hydrolase family protein [Rubrivivax sp.]|jgi:2-keto-4-pentenoate hydratase/2-oxohepta-3-ene-1,7-dioic acid hydratase in catechol pathway|nr:fumarylacetoacetate hydrolase family protein [Rubrivivax sp.]